MGLRFIHSADWHLDRPFKGLSHLPDSIKKHVQDSTFKAMDNILSLAISEQVDFIIIAGDLFDQNHRSIRAQMRAKAGFEQLKKHNIAVYLSHGNHDPLSDPSVQVDFPDNVFVFGSKVSCFEHLTDSGTRVHLYGFSYPNRHITEDMVPYYEKKDGADIHIGILHGSIRGNMDHDNYAPFSLESLETKRLDYWALGHIHKGGTLNRQPFIAYSGDIQGLSSKETGEKGVLLVEWQHDQPVVTSHSTSDMVWLEKVVNASECTDIQSLLIILEQLKNELRKKQVPVLLKIILTGSGPFSEKLQEAAVIEELLDFLRDREDEEETFIWVRSLTSEMTPEWDREDLHKQPSFIGEMLRYSDELDYETIIQTVSGVYSHQRAQRYLDDLSEETAKNIREEAEQFLIHKLYPIQKGGSFSNED